MGGPGNIDLNLSASRYRPESREAAEHRDPRELLAELRDETAAILGDIEALAAELRGAGGVSAWTVVKLSDIATLSSGGTPSKANAAFWDGDIPWVSPKDMKFNRVMDAADKITRAAVSESAARIVGSNSVLAVVRSGILAHTFPVATLAREVSFNQDIKAITPKNGSLLPAFLFWMLKGQEAQILRIGVKKGATVHSLSNGFLESLRFPLPPLHEQRRIVGLLDRAAEIRRRADTARTKARAIIPALFLDTFGDPATNPKGWPVVELGDVIARITGGKNIEAGNGTRKFRIMPSKVPVLCGMFDALQKADIMSGQTMRSRTVAQQGDIAMRRFAIDLLTLGHVGDGMEQPAVGIFCLDHDMAIAPPRDALGRIQTDQRAPGNAVKHAPDFGIRVAA